MPANESTRSINASAVTVNGRQYRWPNRPTIVICFDGCDNQYLAAASEAGVIPSIETMRENGFATTALAAMPTFTNPNNVSIVCGVPPLVHGVSGNYYIDSATGREVMMLDATPMRAHFEGPLESSEDSSSAMPVLLGIAALAAAGGGAWWWTQQREKKRPD